MFFAPASITCFFTPVIGKNPAETGSYGVSIALNKGVRVNVSDKLLVNDREVRFPTVEYVLDALGGKGVEIETDFPLSCGFGMSGASALAAAFAVNEENGLNLPFYRLADLAHEAEVVNRTGLGDVVCQSYGGIVVRVEPGCPSNARVERFLWRLELDILVLGSLKTEEVLSENIDFSVGKDCLKEFMRKPSVENLFVQAKRFSVETGLIEDVMDVIEAVEASGGMASMVMLGKAVFAVNGYEALEEFGEPVRATVSPYGVRFLF
ncbi:pantoate kinase [Archaeoglobus veneficus]|uniref:Pantoate kinase n=1 Tax=Archaeoglobus veneficus (strain DSM 11195 / SNP6) TaxID=693661 RepID=F2KT59_ARCVS|nr:pantoate kinase [Archaeoglobus veneficus]AEA47089.1 GHMP kinase [Archaeoglobus veneficus SNP6]